MSDGLSVLVIPPQFWWWLFIWNCLDNHSVSYQCHEGRYQEMLYCMCNSMEGCFEIKNYQRNMRSSWNWNWPGVIWSGFACPLVGGHCEHVIYWHNHAWGGEWQNGRMSNYSTNHRLISPSPLPLVSWETQFLVNFLNYINIKLWLWIRKNVSSLKSNIYIFHVTSASHG